MCYELLVRSVSDGSNAAIVTVQCDLHGSFPYSLQIRRFVNDIDGQHSSSVFEVTELFIQTVISLLSGKLLRKRRQALKTLLRELKYLRYFCMLQNAYVYDVTTTQKIM